MSSNNSDIIRWFLAVAICLSMNACTSWESGWKTDVFENRPLTDSDYLVVNSPGFSVSVPAGWYVQENSRDLRLVTPRVVKLYFRNDRGSRIVVMYGFKNEYGLSDNIDLSRSELIYFIHIMGRAKGDYRGIHEFRLRNPLFKDALFYDFAGSGTVLGRGRNLSVLLSTGRIICIDFYAEFDRYDEDLPGFINFLEDFRLPGR
ncbi:MAG: hypothetical protein ACE5GM_11175 [bacterium]